MDSYGNESLQGKDKSISKYNSLSGMPLQNIRGLSMDTIAGCSTIYVRLRNGREGQQKPRVFAIFRQGAKSSSPVRDGLESRKLKPIMRCLCVAHISQSMNALGRALPELNAGEGTALKNSLTSLKLPQGPTSASSA